MLPMPKLLSGNFFSIHHEVSSYKGFFSPFSLLVSNLGNLIPYWLQTSQAMQMCFAKNWICMIKGFASIYLYIYLWYRGVVILWVPDIWTTTYPPYTQKYCTLQVVLATGKNVWLTSITASWYDSEHDTKISSRKLCYNHIVHLTSSSDWFPKPFTAVAGTCSK